MLVNAAPGPNTFRQHRGKHIDQYNQQQWRAESVEQAAPLPMNDLPRAERPNDQQLDQPRSAGMNKEAAGLRSGPEIHQQNQAFRREGPDPPTRSRPAKNGRERQQE